MNMVMREILFVAAGGALGSVGRYLVSKMVATSFPWGTFAVNILGSLLIGLLTGFFNRGALSPEMKLLFVTGFCGGFTTFSTFANESFNMLKGGDVVWASVYVGSSVAVGLLAVYCGLHLAETIK